MMSHSAQANKDQNKLETEEQLLQLWELRSPLHGFKDGQPLSRLALSLLAATSL